METEDLISVTEAAKLLDVSFMTVYRWIRANKIQAHTVAGLICIDKKEVARVQRERASGQEAPTGTGGER